MKTESRNTINQEIQEMAPALVAMGAKNPFSVPSGYFSAQGEALSFGISDQQDPVFDSSIVAARSVNPFRVPVDYFKGLLSDVMLSIQAQDAEPVLGESLVALKGKNPFSVPTNYFQGMEEKVLGLVNQEAGIGMSREAASASFKVPENYFETLPGRILDRVKEEEKGQVKEKGKVRELKEVGQQAPKVSEPAPEKAKGGGIRRMLTLATAAAAVFLLMFVGSGLLESFKNEGNGPTALNEPFDLEGAFAGLSDDDFNYFLEGADLDADLMGEYIDMENFSEFDNLDDELLNEMLLLEFDENTLKDNLL